MSADDFPLQDDLLLLSNTADIMGQRVAPARILHNGRNMQASLSTLDRGEVIRFERHKQDQVVLVLRGSLVVLDDAEVQHPLYEGQVAFIPGSARHRVQHSGSMRTTLLTIYSPKAHSGATYNWPKHDTPPLDPARRYTPIQTFDPYQLAYQARAAFSMDVMHTESTSVGVAVLLNDAEYHDELRKHLIPWNREAYYYVFSGDGLFSAEDNPTPLELHPADLLYCAGKHDRESPFTYHLQAVPSSEPDAPPAGGVRHTATSALYCVCISSGLRDAEYYPPRMAHDKRRPPRLPVPAEIPETLPAPEVYSVAEVEPPAAPPVPPRPYTLLEQIQSRPSLRSASARSLKTPAAKTTDTLLSHLSRSIDARRQRMRVDVEDEQEEESGGEDDWLSDEEERQTNSERRAVAEPPPLPPRNAPSPEPSEYDDEDQPGRRFGSQYPF
jgi:quercetin dioxygenase-like cupin family protein